jgi:hypothetical protein
MQLPLKMHGGNGKVAYIDTEGTLYPTYYKPAIRHKLEGHYSDIGRALFMSFSAVNEFQVSSYLKFLTKESWE